MKSKTSTECRFCQADSGGGAAINHFFCPHDGLIHQEHVLFVCNRCRSEEMIYVNGMYVCPECFEKPDGFECRFCGSREVKMASFG